MADGTTHSDFDCENENANTSATVDHQTTGANINAHPQRCLPDESLIEPVTAANPHEEGQIRSGKLAGKTMWSAIWILALPVLLQQTMNACVGMFDKIIGGALPNKIVVPALDGLGVGAYIGWFTVIAMAGLGIGGQAIIARAMGAGRHEESHHALGQAILVALSWGAFIGILLWFLAPLVGWITRLTPEAAMYCNHYCRAMAVAMPLCAVMQVGSFCMHGAGETAKPSMIAIGINVVNIVTSWIFSGADLRWGDRVFENPFSFDWHVIGIGAGTAIAYAVGGIWTAIVLLRGVKDLRLETPHLRKDWSMIRRIVRIGIPNFCEGMSMWGVNLFVLTFIGIIAHRHDNGEGLQGSHVIAVQWEAFSFMPGFAIGQAAGALSAQYLGAGNVRMAKKAVLTCVAIGSAVMVTLGIIIMIFGRQLTMIVSDHPVHVETVPKLLIICGAAQIFFAIAMVTRQALNGMGDTKATFIITTISSYLFRLPLVFLLGIVLDLGLTGVWFGLCGEFVVRAALFSGRFLHGGWQRIRV